MTFMHWLFPLILGMKVINNVMVSGKNYRCLKSMQAARTDCHLFMALAQINTI